MPKNIITIGVGGAGCRMAAAFLEELQANLPNGPDASQSAFFEATNAGYAAPRAVFVDTDPREMQAFRESMGQSRTSLSIHPDSIVQGTESATRSFSRAYLAQVDTRVPTILDRVRKRVDVGAIDGFLVFHALGGGTGSGLGAKLVKELRSHYRKKSVMTVSLLPDVDVGGSPNDPINSALALRFMQPKIDMGLLADNDELRKRAGSRTHARLNRELARAVANWGLMIELGTAGPATLQTKLISSPAIPYVMVSRAANKSASLDGLIDRAFGAKGAHASYSATALSRKRLSSVLLWRGGAKSKEINAAHQQLGSRGTPGAGIYGYTNPTQQGSDRRTLAAFSSHSGIADLLDRRILKPYERLLERNVFIDSEKKSGLSASKFTQAKTNLRASIEYYRDQTA